MSLGDYEHTFRVVVSVVVRSKREKPNAIDEPRDIGDVVGQDGVDITTVSCEHVGTVDTMPVEVRRSIG